MRWPISAIVAGLSCTLAVGTAAGAAEKEALRALRHVRRLIHAAQLPDGALRVGADGPFAFALHESGKLDGGLDKWYPQGMANLYALAAFKDAPRPLWLKAQRRFPKELRSMPALWLLAAHRFGDAQAAARYRAAVVQLAQGMSLSTHRLDQLAHALGALVCDRASLPLIPLPPTAP